MHKIFNDTKTIRNGMFKSRKEQAIKSSHQYNQLVISQHGFQNHCDNVLIKPIDRAPNDHQNDVQEV